MAAFGKILMKYIYTIQITVSSINLDAKYINADYRWLERIGARDLHRISIEQYGKHYQRQPEWLVLSRLHDKRCLMHAF